jgi:hypothetical protein
MKDFDPRKYFMKGKNNNLPPRWGHNGGTMKNKKKFGRKLSLNRETIATLEQRNVHGGRPVETRQTTCCVPCCKSIPTEVICTLYDCPGSANSCAGTCSC